MPSATIRSTRSTAKNLPLVELPLKKRAKSKKDTSKQQPTSSPERLPKRQLLDEEEVTRLEQEDEEELRQLQIVWKEEEEKKRQHQQVEEAAERKRQLRKDEEDQQLMDQLEWEWAEDNRQKSPTVSDLDDQFFSHAPESTPDSIQEDEADVFNSETLPDSITITLNFRRGEPLGALRQIKGWPAPTWNHAKEDGFGLLIGRITNGITQLKALKPENKGLIWPDSVPYVQPTNSTKQRGYIPVYEDDYSEVLAKAWNSERKRLGNSSGDISVKLYVYLRDTGVTSQTIQRASKKIIEEAHRLINSAKASSAKKIGKFTQAFLSRDIAAGVVPHPQEGTIEIPNNPVYTQAARLDERAEQEEDQQQQIINHDNGEYRTVRMLMFDNQWTRVRFHIKDLRQALGLPNMDITDLLQRPMDPPPRPSPDVPDYDHEEEEEGLF